MNKQTILSLVSLLNIYLISHVSLSIFQSFACHLLVLFPLFCPNLIPEDARVKFKKYVNTLAQTKTEGDEKFLVLKTRYQNSLDYSRPSQLSPQTDPRLALGIPLSPSLPDYSPSKSPAHRQPPPYRPPPPVTSPTNSLDNISLSSIMSQQDVTPQAPPRRKQKSFDEDYSTPKCNNQEENGPNEEKQTVSVKERMEKFNRMASMEDELSPRQPKSAEKKREKVSQFGLGF